MIQNLNDYWQAVFKTTQDDRLRWVADAILAAVHEIGELVETAPIRGILGKLGQENVQGETQAKLDVITNDVFIKHLTACEAVAGLASEEMDDPIYFERENNQQNYLVVFDPLDGSSNIENNISIGSIFSVLKAPVGRAVQREDFLQSGTAQVLAGYSIYGASTILVLTMGEGVNGFTLNRASGEFLRTHAQMRVPEATQEFAINMSNQRFWEPPIQRYISECLAGETGVRGKDFNMRWVGSMVAEVHRILMRGGVYIYPKDNKQPARAGRLRLMYELNPLGWVVNQAGGKSSTAREAILSITPTDIHQRVPIVLGSKQEVERIEQYHLSN